VNRLRWAAVLLAALGLGLLPWTLWLALSLPSEKLAKHWDLAWVGFDLLLAALLLSTAYTFVRRSPYLEAFAAASGALLLADAWFDVITASTSRERWFAIGLALVGELPAAAVCFVLVRPRPAG
jgi:hypothetical protein